MCESGAPIDRHESATHEDFDIIEGNGVGRIAEFVYTKRCNPESAENSAAESMFALNVLHDEILCGGMNEVILRLRVSSDAIINEDANALQGVLTCVGELKKVHTDSISAIRVSADGSIIVAGSLDGTVSIYLTSDYSCIGHYHEMCSEVEHIAFAPKGVVFLVACVDGSAWVYHARLGYIACTTSHACRLTACKLVSLPEDRTFRHPLAVVTAADGYITVFNPATGESMFRVKISKDEPTRGDILDLDIPTGVLCLAHKPNTVVLTLGTAAGEIVDFSLAKGLVLSRFEAGLGIPIEALAYKPDNPSFLAAADASGSIHVIQDGTVRLTLEHDQENVVCITHLLWHEYLLVSVGNDGCIRIFDSRDGSDYDTYSAGGIVNDVQISFLNGQLCLVAACDDGTVHLWQILQDDVSPTIF